MPGLNPGDLASVRNALARWPEDSPLPATLSASARRLLLAMRAAAGDTASVGAADLAVLLRHVARAETEMTQTLFNLATPIAQPWPTAAEWRLFGFDVVGTDAERLRVQANPWRPDWLDGQQDPAAAAFRGSNEHTHRESENLRADGFFREATGRRSYRSLGQRAAIRWAASAVPGATLVANLPTGSGKSTVGYMQALTKARGTTVFVIPTTSLALDQSRAFADLVANRTDARAFPLELAYHAELTDEAKRDIRSGVADGSQGIVFVSPEAVASGLSSALYLAAERGLLNAFVVDEAHVVAQWGAEFRPAFQAIAGLREDLLAVCRANGRQPFQTVLLSATITQDSLDVLGVLFGNPGPTTVVSSAALRHEPSYWVSLVGDSDQRRRRVIDALRHLPRPAIVYTTKVVDARELQRDLFELGWRRSHVVTGRSSAAERRAAIDRLRDQSLDLVIATSAFGLGVDQPDVRSVVHACVPETLDRWYQEVGRGGRDGEPSVAMMIASNTDLQVARELSRRKIISIDRGRERWDAMLAERTPLPEGRMRIPLTAMPSDLEIDSDRNRAWNLRTLLLLHRAGVLSLESQAPPRRQSGEDEDTWAARADSAFEEHTASAVVHLRRSTDDNELWASAVVSVRDRAHSEDEAAHAAMRGALQRHARICALLRSTYVIDRPIPSMDIELPIVVAQSCGGCPGCRRLGCAPRQLEYPTPRCTIGGDHHGWRASWLSSMTVREPLVLLADPRDDATVRQAIRTLAARGLWVLDSGHMKGEFVDLHRLAPHGVVFDEPDWLPWNAPSLPTAVVRLRNDPEPYLLDAIGPPRVIIVDQSAIDPRHGRELVERYHSNVARIEHFLQQT